MRGKISDGNLYIERNDKMVLQRCPYQTRDIACGQWCPLFGNLNEGNTNLNLHKLKLCQRELIFYEFYK